MTKKVMFPVIKAIALLLIINVAASFFYARFDLTEDKRYTLSDAALNAVSAFENPVIIDVLLDGDELPAEFAKLRQETRLLLQEFATENNNLKFGFA
ncbi:MAG: Gldg family protein, partial [Flavobacteriaceae bacterium]